ncbi:MAG: TolC family protein, partial [Acidobacteriota bacterium]
RIAADSAWVRRRQLEARPDFRVGLSYTAVGDREDPAGVLTPPADNGQDILALAVGINIPLFRKRIASGVAEAQAHRRSSQRDLDDVLEELRFLLRRSLVRLDSLGERTSLYTDTLIPQAGESLASAEAAYTTNRLGILDLLDAERVLFQLRLTHQRLVADSWIALADVEFAFGEPFPRGGPTR